MAIRKSADAASLEHAEPDDRGYSERNLCAASAGHDDCPYKQIDAHGVLIFCNCPCHLDPESLP